jgi:hypothetical protein
MDMKVMALKLNAEDFLSIKSVYFRPENREATRQHVIKETGADYVWFQDEAPPQAIVEAIEETAARMGCLHEEDDNDYDEFGDADPSEAN